MVTIFGAGRVNATFYLLVMYNHHYFYKKKNYWAFFFLLFFFLCMRDTRCYRPALAATI